MAFQTVSRLFCRKFSFVVPGWRVLHEEYCKITSAAASSVKSKRIWRNTRFIRLSSNVFCRYSSAGTPKSPLKDKDHRLSVRTKGIEDNFQVVYKLSWIKHFRFISRVKILHVGIVTSLTWPMFYWYSQGSISTAVFMASVTAAAATMLGLAVLSYFFRRVVGQLSVDTSNRKVVISTLTFWGNRRDRTFPIDALTPLTDSGLDPKRIFQRLELAGTTELFLINLQHGKVYDEKMFNDTIGIPVGLDGIGIKQQTSSESKTNS